MALRPETEDALERGRGLFNAGLFYEAHEAWEEAWLREEGEVRQLLQGLIQVAAGYLKALRHRNARGSARLLAAGLEKLSALPPDFAGLSLGLLREGAAPGLAEAQRWAAGQGAGLVARAPRLDRVVEPPGGPA